MWFHISKKFVGKNKTFMPKVPESALKDEEGNIPRICVSDSLYRCLLGLIGYSQLRSYMFSAEFKENPCVYFTEKTPYLPPNASDFRRTNEHWFLYPTDFYFAARLDMYNLFENHYIVPTNSVKARYPKEDVIIENEPLYDFMPRVIKGVFHG